ncbi:cupin domain-containing protein [Paenibacillus sp. 1P03SA]|uniref:cupin domain-containing protein n=1 Tax=Paenibacillus sp. 1P03SA TaxID=3132294 RepID=UPI0039A0FCE5
MSGYGYRAGPASYHKSSGMPNLAFNVGDNVLYKRNEDNVAYEVTSTQLPPMTGGAFTDLRLGRGHIREPHWHPNAWELHVIVSGEAEISVMCPDNPRLVNYRAKEGQVVFVPTGWWHWITPVSEKVHLHGFFNHDQPETVYGSDILRLTPPEVLQNAYNVNAALAGKALAPITESVRIGPPVSVHSEPGKPANPGQPYFGEKKKT